MLTIQKSKEFRKAINHHLHTLRAIEIVKDVRYALPENAVNNEALDLAQKEALIKLQTVTSLSEVLNPGV